MKCLDLLTCPRTADRRPRQVAGRPTNTPLHERTQEIVGPAINRAVAFPAKAIVQPIARRLTIRRLKAAFRRTKEPGKPRIEGSPARAALPSNAASPQHERTQEVSKKHQRSHVGATRVRASAWHERTRGSHQAIAGYSLALATVRCRGSSVSFAQPDHLPVRCPSHRTNEPKEGSAWAFD